MLTSSISISWCSVSAARFSVSALIRRPSSSTRRFLLAFSKWLHNSPSSARRFLLVCSIVVSATDSASSSTPSISIGHSSSSTPSISCCSVSPARFSVSTLLRMPSSSTRRFLLAFSKWLHNSPSSARRFLLVCSIVVSATDSASISTPSIS